MDDNLPMDSGEPEPQNIVLVGRFMPTPAKAWIMQVRRQKHTADVHWVSWIPMKHYRRNAWNLLRRGQVRWWRFGAPWERLPVLFALRGQYHRASVQSRLAHNHAWGEFWDMWRRCSTAWTHHAYRWQITATSHERW